MSAKRVCSYLSTTQGRAQVVQQVWRWVSRARTEVKHADERSERLKRAACAQARDGLFQRRGRGGTCGQCSHAPANIFLRGVEETVGCGEGN